MSIPKPILIVSPDPAALSRAEGCTPAPQGETLRVTTYGEAVAFLFGEGWARMPARVLIDVDLPDGSGLDLIERIRRDPWLRRATLVQELPEPLPAPAPLEADLTDEMILDGLSFAGIP